ncbi:MAG: tyrosine-type recombinase/integrase [Christensenellales bacterium]
MDNDSYFEQRKINTITKLREIKMQLPFICNEYFMGIQNSTSELTQLGYASDLRLFFEFLTTQILEFQNVNIRSFNYQNLQDVTTTHIEMFLEYVTYYESDGKSHHNSLKTKARKLASLKSFFKYNYNKNNIFCDPAAKVMTPKLLEKPIIRLDVNEVVELLNAVEDGEGLSRQQQTYHNRTAKRDLAIMTLFLGTGIRISELVGLNIDDIDFTNNAFKITRKGGNQTILYFGDEVAQALLQYLDERAKNQQQDQQPALFLSLQNKRINVRTVQNLVKKYAKIVTPLKHITPHKLRSTYGTTLYQNTNDIYVVAEVLGHKDINTTKKHYAAISDEIKRAASKKVTLRDNVEQEKSE